MDEDECNSTIDQAENEHSDSGSSVLSLRYSSSPFQSRKSSSDAEECWHRVEPYSYEPEDSGTEDPIESSDDETGRERLNNTEW